MRDATLKQLRSLAATIKAGTIVGAARQLHVTPPAVAEQLRLLERSVGIPLLDRGPDGPRPTDAGREMVATISRVEAELEGCRRQLELIRDGKIGSVVFGAVSTAKYFAPQLLAAFWELHPSIDVKLVIGNRNEIIRGLSTYDLDQVIMGRPPDQLDLETSVIGSHPHVIIASPRHHLAQRRRISQSALVQERFLVREQGSGTRILTEQLFSTVGVQPLIAMEITSNETIKQAVMADLGVALISAHTVAAEIDDGRLVTLNVVGLPIVRQWYAVRRSALRLSPAGALFWSFLTEHAYSFLPHGSGTASPATKNHVG
ncbi:MAG: LysR family transcriptional regulator [Ilumatobacteraceae bacterium]